MGEYFFLNGEIIKARDACLHITDLALLRGFGIFDFCRTQNGQPLLIDKYISRFHNSAHHIDMQIPYSKDHIKESIYALLQKNRIKEAGIRMVMTGGYTKNGYTPGDPNFFILIEKINFPDREFYENGIKLHFLEHQRELSHIKSINYLTPISIRNTLAKESAYDVLYHSRGNVLEVSRSNIFIVRDNTIITPIKNILPGITRSSVLTIAKEIYQVEEREIPVQELFIAEEVFMTGTTKRVLPVRQIDDHVINHGKPGSITQKLKSLYREFENSFTTFPNPGDQK
jgi:branched-subunit amino acid aminotransferase/4-amino-4-deoxychorismate lyase